MTVGTVIVTYNISSEIFLLQVAAIKKFCKDDFTIEVIDNSSDLEKAEGIRYHCSVLGLNYMKTFGGGMGSASHAFSANFAYGRLKDSYDLFFFADHDVIPVQAYSVVEILSGGHVMAGIGQGTKKKYLWPGCVMWDRHRVKDDLIDFSTNSEFNLDTGGNLYKVVEEYGMESIVFFNESYHQNPYYQSKDYGHYAMINNEMFMHFTNGSNWARKERHDERINALLNIAREKTGL